MSNKYKIEYLNGITKIKYFQKPIYSDAKEIIDEVVDKFPYEKRLWDFSLVKFNFTMDEIASIAEYGKLKFTKPNKLAIIAFDDLTYGEFKIFESHREQENLSEARVFRTEIEAVEWLESD